MVRQQGSAQVSADVLVGVNHFSKRTIQMSSGDGSGTDGNSSDGNNSDESSPDGDGSENDSTIPSDGQPGFGVVVALVALGTALLARS